MYQKNNHALERSPAAVERRQKLQSIFPSEIMAEKSRARGNALSIQGLTKSEKLRFKRAAILAGAPSISAWLSRSIARLIREMESKHGDILNALTPAEQDIMEAVESGAAEPEHIASEAMIPPSRLEIILADLVSRGLLEIRKQGGKTEGARGARRPLYFA